MLKQKHGEMANPTPKVDMIAKGVATGVAVSTIVQTSRGIVSALARNPLVMFGVGVAAGYFAHKYRKEIISVTRHTAEQTKDFVLRQKENLQDMLAESQEKQNDQK